MRFIPKNVIVRPQQVHQCVGTFDALLRNNLYWFSKRCASSFNFFIRSLHMFDAFYESSLFLNHLMLLYNDVQLQ